MSCLGMYEEILLMLVVVLVYEIYRCRYYQPCRQCGTYIPRPYHTCSDCYVIAVVAGIAGNYVPVLAARADDTHVMQR